MFKLLYISLLASDVMLIKMSLYRHSYSILVIILHKSKDNFALNYWK